MNTINGMPLIWNEEEDNQLFGQLLSNFNNSGFPANTTNKSFPVFKSPLVERERPEDGSKLLTNKPLSVFDNDFGYWVTANKYLSGREVINSFLQTVPMNKEVIFFCETSSQDSSNLFGTTFLIKFGPNFKNLLNNLYSGEKIKINSKLNTNSATTANQVSSFDALLMEIHNYLIKVYDTYIEKDYLTFDLLKKKIIDEISISSEIKKTIGETMSWYNDGVKYVIETADSFLENLLFTKEDYTPKKDTEFSDSLENILETVTDYVIPPSIQEKLGQISTAVSKLVNASIPESWRQLIQKIYGYIEQAIDLFNSLGNIIIKGFNLYKAFLCGIINGLISTIQFIIQVIGWLSKNHFNDALTGELYTSIQSKLEFIEDFIDVIYQAKDEFIEGIQNLYKNFELNTCIEIIQSFFSDLTDTITIYDLAYYSGRIIFEILIGVILTYFTGVGGAIKAATSVSEKIAILTKTIAREALSVATGGIIDLVLILKKFLLKFVQAAKNGWKALQKFFEEIINGIKNTANALKAKIILSSGVVLHCEIIPISTFANRLKNILKAKWLQELEELGLIIAKQSDDVYSFVYKGVEIYKGKKLGAEKRLKKYFEESKNINLEKYLDEILKYKPKLVDDYWTVTNKAGTELKWVYETTEEILKKADSLIEKAKNAEKLMIERGLNFSQMGTKQQNLLSSGLEAEVIKEFSKYDEILEFANSVKKGGDKIGEFDGLVEQYLIEVKYNVSGDTKSGEFLKQFKKYLEPNFENYINLENRKVVLFIKEFSKGGHINQSVLKELQKKGVIIIAELSQIKKLY